MVIIYTISIMFAILMQAFFAASETALTCTDGAKLKGLVDTGNKFAIKLEGFLKKKGAYLGTTLIGTNIAVVAASALATRIFAEYFNPEFSAILATVILVPITLLFAEIIPKIIARYYSLDFALRIVSPLTKFSKLFHPLIVFLNAVSGFLLWPFRGQKPSWDYTLTKGDIKQMLLLGHQTGEVEADEVELIHNVLDLGSITVEKIMVPLYKVSSIETDDEIKNLKKLVSITGFSRVPVYEKNKNNIVGIVNIYDILFTDRGEDVLVKDFIRESVCINRKDPLDMVLTRLRHSKQPMGIVVDENSAVCGIITIEDILEEIVGEIEDTA